MKKLFSLLSLVLLSTNLFAHAFEVDGIYYNYGRGDSVTVTYKGNDWDSYASYNEYVGDVVIPEIITYNEKIYHVTAIDTHTFWESYNVTSFTLPNSITSIGSFAFERCGGTKNLKLPSKLQAIGQCAFIGCQFDSIIIPQSVIRIGRNIFEGCSSLESIEVENGNTVYHSTNNCLIETETRTLLEGCNTSIIPDDGSVTIIGAYAFYGRGITSINLPDSISSIGNMAFYRTDLTLVSIPNDVKHIGSQVFEYCSNLKSVVLGSGLVTMGSSVFSNCRNLKTIICESLIPPTIGSLNDADENNPSIIVPCESLEAYKTASVWGHYASNIQGSFDYTFSAVSANDLFGSVNITQYPSCENNGYAIFEAKPAEGYKFVSWNDGNTDNPRTITVTVNTELTAYFVSISPTTALENVDIETHVQKMFDDGTIYVLRNGEKYTVDGRKVK